MMMEKPYISFVATSRNDNHGGNILKRMRLFVRGLLHQTRRFRLPAELIIVEWNPPADRPLLHEVLPAPQPGDMLTIRYIIVPEPVHKRYVRSDVIPLFQMIGKNVGIRRAKGEFILCTNIDLLFSDALFLELSKRNLKPGYFYRANRCDVPDAIDESWSYDRQMAFCKNNIIRTLGKDFRYLNLTHVPQWVYRYHGLAKTLDKLWLLMRRWFEHPPKSAFNRLDTSACGDFTMMSKQAWMEIAGYPELDLYSIHVDTLGLIAAAAAGYRQYIFHPDACIYHIDHPTGWEAMTPMDKIRFSEERPGLGFDVVWETAMYMLDPKNNHRKLALNNPEWGFADMDFKEITLVP